MSELASDGTGSAEALPILYKDDHILILDKPSGLLSVPGRLPENKDSLASRAQQLEPEARTVHRLDCETSGVTVMALDADSHRELSRQFHDREVLKTYVAICAGMMETEQGEVNLPLVCDWPNRPRQMVDHENGKQAQTFWRVIHREPDRTWVQLTPITGRSHQLRVHLREIGHPILGDRLYAPPEVMRMAPRLLLHAEMLSFSHPHDGRKMTFYAPCPF
ncbi:Pseudouridine synthase [Sulfidibacter corallicola]|uniref:Pseudouridine synthase n=1 Tax=Sulfidibacter corallicola TaxID=2818388 RepID=A0A8A4TYK2_SULCO|nr:RluA family pseudouridine synthase [Sulfidibacter corallicola]QTD54407.1 RluA family pseudouridine synthase [Sulfidibacter corallicola]